MILEYARTSEDTTSVFGIAKYTIGGSPISIAERFGMASWFSSSPAHEPPLDRYWESVREDAKEFGYSEPSGRVFACAELLFPDVLSGYHGKFDIYPTDDGEIVLDAYVRGEEYSSSVLLICRPDGQVLCSVVIGKDIRGKLFSGDDVCVNSFIEQAFSDLKKETVRSHVQPNYYSVSEIFEHRTAYADWTQVVLKQ